MQLRENFAIEFDRLFTITNMPIKRFAEFLFREGKHEAYMALLTNHFNPATVEGLMCRDLVSIGWDGKIYDCDFNQMLDMETPGGKTVWEIESCRRAGGKTDCHRQPLLWLHRGRRFQLRRKPAMTPPHAIEVNPADEFNKKLVENAHPPDWTNPKPAGRYNL